MKFKEGDSVKLTQIFAPKYPEKSHILIFYRFITNSQQKYQLSVSLI